LESNWRWNVHNLGFGDSPFRLIARRTPPAPLSYWVGLYVLGSVRYWVESLVPTPLQIGDWTLIQEAPPSHFPFGRKVEPD
jgi:hypothetical protein